MSLSATAEARRRRWRMLAIAPLAVMLVLAGCSSNKTKLARLSPDTLYERASKAMNNNDFAEAIKTYEALTARYPFTDQARQARLDLIYAYYKNKEKESAIDAAETFIRENPAHPRVDYAWYLKGLVDFERTPYKFERWLGVDLTDRPPNTARKSFQAFKVVVEQFPKSAYAADARQRMIYLRNRLAGYDIAIARYYLKRGAYVAAAQRAASSVEQYDGAPTLRDALQIEIQCYHHLGYEDLAANVEKVYKDNFPNDAANSSGGRKWWKPWERG